MTENIEAAPHEKRLGKLKNGNPSGDFSKAPRCGARNRRGMPCQCPAMPNGRCRLHGGLSTGPKTAQGIERIRQAVTRHGRYSQRARMEREAYRRLINDCREALAAVRLRSQVEALNECNGDLSTTTQLLARAVEESTPLRRNPSQ